MELDHFIQMGPSEEAILLYLLFSAILFDSFYQPLFPAL